jgi:peptidoglycan/LPS O-acetylase OafA/YrhL
MSAMRSDEKARGFLTSVESVRGVAAAYVALGHAMSFLLVTPLSKPIFDQLTWRDVLLRGISALFEGHVAVIVFFVISGLVIGRSLDAKSISSLHAYAVFLARRGLRLYPAHIVATLCIIALAYLFLVGRPPADFSAHPEFDADMAGWFNGKVFDPLKWRSVIGNLTMASWSLNLVVWSLYVEIIAAPLLPLFHRLSRECNPMIDVGVVTGLVVITLLSWGYLFAQYWFVFYLGMLVQTRGRAWAGFLSRRFGFVPAFVIAYLVMMMPNALTVDRPPPVIMLEACGSFTLICMIVWCDKSALVRLLEHPVLRWNGRLSYSFYLWHLFILTLVIHALYAALPPDVMRDYDLALFTVTAIGTIGVALAVAQLSYTFVELPFIRLGRYLEKRDPVIRAAQTSVVSAGTLATAVPLTKN